MKEVHQNRSLEINQISTFEKYYSNNLENTKLVILVTNNLRSFETQLKMFQNDFKQVWKCILPVLKICQVSLKKLTYIINIRKAKLFT